MADKLEEALIKVRLKLAFLPSLGRGWGGAQLRQREKQNYLFVRGLSARADLF
jgi:hypothetical protein